MPLLSKKDESSSPNKTSMSLARSRKEKQRPRVMSVLGSAESESFSLDLPQFPQLFPALCHMETPGTLGSNNVGWNPSLALTPCGLRQS